MASKPSYKASDLMHLVQLMHMHRFAYWFKTDAKIHRKCESFNKDVQMTSPLNERNARYSCLIMKPSNTCYIRESFYATM